MSIKSKLYAGFALLVLHDLVTMLSALAEGDLSERIVAEYRGDFATLKNNANA